MRSFSYDLRLHLVGRLRLVTRQGVEVTPRAMQLQALLALLGASPGCRRQRAWLQDKLWSESPPEQGSADFRQALRRLRRALGDYQDCILTDGAWVGLDPERVEVVLAPSAEDWDLTGEPPEFAAGLDVADPEFEDWLRDQRSAVASLLEATVAEGDGPPLLALADIRRARPILTLMPGEANQTELKALADIVTDEVGAMIAQVGDAEVVHAGTAHAGIETSPGFGLVTKVFGAGGRAMVQVQLSDARRGEILWNGRRTLGLAEALAREDGDLERLVSTAAAAVIFEFGKARTGSDDREMAGALGFRALHLLSDFDATRLDEVDTLFEQAWQHNPAPVLLAWRAFIAFIQVMERLPEKPEEARERAIGLGRRALDLDPFNAVSAALVSDVIAVLEGRADEAQELAIRAISAQPSSPFAAASLAYRLAWHGDAEAAFRKALSARALSAGHFNPTWWDIRCFITAARAGRYDDAIKFAETAHRRSPTLRPPLRFLAALKYARRDEAGALQALTELKRLEPDFSLDLFGSEGYPVRSLHGTPLMKIARSGLL